MEKSQIENILDFYKCPCDILGVRKAANFTDYLLQPVNGTTINRLQARVADFSLMIGSAVSIAIENSILLLRVANKTRVFYDYFTYIGNMEKRAGNIALGINPAGVFISDNLFTMPHLLAAGATGSGKSVFIHNAIISLASCGGVCFRMIDLKRVELSIYNGCRFMVSDCVTDAAAAAAALESEVAEMENRYKLMEKQRVNHYTQLKNPILARVIVIDELADLMLNKETRKRVELSIVRIAQLGRAAGCHLILATQRPSRDVITGLIKANIPARVAFTTASAIDSRVIGITGAEKLTGAGDAIYAATGKQPERVQSLYFEKYRPIDFINQVKANQTQYRKNKSAGKTIVKHHMPFWKRLLG